MTPRGGRAGTRRRSKRGPRGLDGFVQHYGKTPDTECGGHLANALSGLDAAAPGFDHGEHQVDAHDRAAAEMLDAGLHVRITTSPRRMVKCRTRLFNRTLSGQAHPPAARGTAPRPARPRRSVGRRTFGDVATSGFRRKICPYWFTLAPVVLPSGLRSVAMVRMRARASAEGRGRRRGWRPGPRRWPARGRRPPAYGGYRQYGHRRRLRKRRSESDAAWVRHGQDLDARPQGPVVRSGARDPRI